MDHISRKCDSGFNVVYVLKKPWTLDCFVMTKLSWISLIRTLSGTENESSTLSSITTYIQGRNEVRWRPGQEASLTQCNDHENALALWTERQTRHSGPMVSWCYWHWWMGRNTAWKKSAHGNGGDVEQTSDLILQQSQALRSCAGKTLVMSFICVRLTSRMITVDSLKNDESEKQRHIWVVTTGFLRDNNLISTTTVEK